MRTEPSAIDQVFRHWPAEWPTRAQAFASLPGTVYVNCENIQRHLESWGDALPAPGCVAPPWRSAVLYWTSRLLRNAGTCHTMVLLHAIDPDPASEDVLLRDHFELHGLVFRHDRGRETFLSGLFCFLIPQDGFLPRFPDGAEYLPGSVLGAHRASSPSLRHASSLATAICGSESVQASDAASLRNPTCWTNDAFTDVTTCLFTFGFANCRNIVQRECGRTSPPKPWRKSGVPTVRYRVLGIDGAATAARGTSEVSDPNGPPRRLSLHIVRGHFAHYSPERPLFGKYAGTFWMPQHVRGSPSAGVVVKDYRVGPPPLATAGAAR